MSRTKWFMLVGVTLYDLAFCVDAVIHQRALEAAFFAFLAGALSGVIIWLYDTQRFVGKERALMNEVDAAILRFMKEAEVHIDEDPTKR